MGMKQVIRKLSEEINGKMRTDVIDILEDMLIENIEKLSTSEDFFQLPLNSIFSLTSKVNFNNIEESDNIIDIIRNIIQSTIKSHYESKESLLILNNIDISNISLSYEDVLSLLELFTNCPILTRFCKLCRDNQQLIESRYEEEIQQKCNEIEELKQEINTNSIPFEKSIFKVCMEGQLSIVNYLIKGQYVDPNVKAEKDEKYYYFAGDAPIHIASRYGHLEIVQYLVENYNVDIYTPNKFGDAPIHIATVYGHLPIVKYFIEKHHVDVDIRGFNGKTPYLYSAWYPDYHVQEYLGKNKADMYLEDKEGISPRAVMLDNMAPFVNCEPKCIPRLKKGPNKSWPY